MTKFMKVSKYLSGRRLRIGGWAPTYGQTHAAGGRYPGFEAPLGTLQDLEGPWLGLRIPKR